MPSSNQSNASLETTPLLENSSQRKPPNERIHHIKSSGSRKAAILLACISLQMCTTGIGFGLGIMYAELIRVFNSTRTEAALIQSLFMGITAGLGIIWSVPLNRFGPGPCLIVGGVIACVGMIISSFATQISTIVVFTGVMSSIGLCVSYLAPFIVISALIPENAGVYVVFLTIGSSFGQFIIPFIFEISISAYSWQGAFLVVSGVALQPVITGTFIYAAYKSQGATAHESTKIDVTSLRSLLKDVVIILLMVNTLILSITGGIESWFITDILVSRGYDLQAGSSIISLMGLAQVFSRCVGGVMKMKIQVPTAYHLVYLTPLMAVGHTAVILFRPYEAILSSCVLYAFFYGITVSQIGAVMLEASGLKMFPAAMSMVIITYGSGNFFGGFFGGVVKDVYGEYDNMFYISDALTLYVTFSTVIVIIIMERRKRKEAGRDRSDMSYTILVQENKTR